MTHGGGGQAGTRVDAGTTVYLLGETRHQEEIMAVGSIRALISTRTCVRQSVRMDKGLDVPPIHCAR